MYHLLVMLFLLTLKVELRESKKSHMTKVFTLHANYILFSGFATFEDLRIDCCKKYDLGELDIFGLLIEFLPSYPIMIDRSYDIVGN